MSEAKQPNDVDRYVGQQIRQARRELRMTQEAVGKEMNLTFQQVQKYEKGINRISAGRLLAFAELFDRPLEFFFPKVAITTKKQENAALRLEFSDLRKKVKKLVSDIDDIEDLRALAHWAEVAARR